MPGQSLADLPPVITVKETARLLRLSRSAAYRRIEAGQIEAFKLGERWFVPTAPLKRKLGCCEGWHPSTRQGLGMVFLRPRRGHRQAPLLQQERLPHQEGRSRGAQRRTRTLPQGCLRRAVETDRRGVPARAVVPSDRGTAAPLDPRQLRDQPEGPHHPGPWSPEAAATHRATHRFVLQ